MPSGLAVSAPFGRSGFRLLVSCLAVAAIFPAPAVSQDRLTPEEAAKLSRQTGLVGARTYISSEDIAIPPSGLDILEQSRTIEAGLREYEALHNRFASAKRRGESDRSALKTITDLGSAGAETPLGSVGMVLSGMIAQSSLSAVERDAEDLGRAAADAYISNFGAQVMTESGIDSLQAFDGRPEELRQMLREGVGRSGALLEDLRARASAGNADAVVEMASDIIARRMAALDDAALTAMTNVSVDLDGVDNRLTGLVENMQAELDRTKDEMEDFNDAQSAVRADIRRLDGDIAAVNDSLEELGSNQDLIADFVFANMPAADKARMLRQGLADSRIICPEGAPSCNKGQVREALIERFETEARIKENVETAATILRDVKSAARIADDLGVDLCPDGDQAVEIASGAINAYMGFMTGNYLGAIQSITGMFASPKPDPDAVRFQIMMDFLQEQFEAVNVKLDAVLENQQAIHEAVVSVSEQVRESHEILFARLDQIEWLEAQTNANVKRLLWSEWRDCQVLYTYVTTRRGTRPQRVDPGTLRFKDVDSLQATFQDVGYAAEECMKTFQRNNDSLGNVALFGNFLSANSTLAAPPVGVPESTAAEARDFRSDARRFQEQIDIPSLVVLDNWRRSRGFSEGDLLRILAVEVDRLEDVEQLLARIGEDWPGGCDASSPQASADDRGPQDTKPVTSLDGLEAVRSADIDGLVCRKSEAPSDVAGSLLAEGIASSVVIDLAPWAIVMSQTSDWYSSLPPDGQEEFARSLSELASRDLSEQPRGWEITRNMIDIATLASAYENRVFGGLTAKILAEAIAAGEATPLQVGLLRDNEILAVNTALVLMRGTLAELSTPAPSIDKVMVQAVAVSRSSDDRPLEPLTGLFSDQLMFVREDGSGHPRLEIKAGEVTARLPLPGPTQLADGIFLMPPTHGELRRWRDRLVDRLADYELGRDAAMAAAALQPRAR